ncbi:MAG: hypothetical protein ACREC5_04720, partial [Thermoplasmata archaeon]
HRPGTEPEEHHWDLHFVFRGDWPGGPSARAAPFRELRFFAPDELGTLEVARGGADLLRLAGVLP